jgi:preprotein translocase subunit SecD
VAPPSRSAPHPWRALTGLIVIILVMLFSILGSATFSPGKWQHQFKVGLGLDLSSGTQVVLKAATPGNKPPASGEMQQAINVLISRVNGTGNSGAQVQQEGTNLLEVSVPGKAADQVVNLISTTAQLRVRPVLLYEPYGGTTTTPSVTPSGSATPSPSGSSSPTPKASGTPTPAAGTTPTPSSTATKAKTQAYIVHGAPAAAASASPSATGSATSSPKASSSATPTGSATPTVSASATPTPTASTSGPFGDASKVNAATMKLFNELKCTPGVNAYTPSDAWKPSVGYTPANSASTYDNQNGQIVSCDASGSKYVLDKAVFVGGDITSVTTGLQQNSEQWVVDLSLDGKAAGAFGTLTTTQYNSYYSGYQSGNQDDAVLNQAAFVLDGDVQSAPETSSPITAGNVEITGPQPAGFTQAQASQLANVLKYGQLPLTFTPYSISSISAQLGHDSLVAGLFAGIIGLIVVIIYLFMYYRGLGLVSVSSLLIAALLAYLAVVLLSKYQNFTMELSGIAGLIVAIGITADSFIVFFERLRDEVREGKALRPAVESGWKRARRTIIVSDTVSFLAAVLLYHFAVSDVQGFAYTLGLTTLIDVLVVFTFTKPMVTLLAGTKFYGGGHKWSGLDPARLGARNPWRGGTRRVVRNQRTTTASRPVAGSTSGSSTGSTTSTEA